MDTIEVRTGQKGRSRSLSVRDSLALLVLGCILPISAVAAYLVYDYYEREHLRLTVDASSRTRALRAAVDHEFRSIEASLLALATSTHLAAGDFEGFRDRLGNALKNINADAIMLTDETGRLVMSTRETLGAPGALENVSLPIEKVIATGKPAVSELFEAPAMGGLRFAVGVPITRGGYLVGTLDATVRPDQLMHLIAEQQLPASWRVLILDGANIIVARKPHVARFIGARATPQMQHLLATRDEDSLVERSLDGVEVRIVYSRSPSTRWTAQVGIPLDELGAEMRNWMTRLIAACLIALLLGLSLAWFIGGRIARSIGALAEPARQLGLGGPIEIPQLHFQEAVALGSALIDARVTLDRARHDAHHDPLTGLANRVLMNLMINQQIAMCRRYQRELSVLFIDLDEFKRVNDTHGHALGDQLLREVSARLQASIRSADMAARLGGDEFAICLLDTGLPGASNTAQKLIGILSQPFAPSGFEIHISASIGVAVYPATSDDADSLLNAADRAMYRAKSEGKSQVCVAST